jgi:hypothetical protein
MFLGEYGAFGYGIMKREAIVSPAMGLGCLVLTSLAGLTCFFGNFGYFRIVSLLLAAPASFRENVFKMNPE